MAKSNTKDGEAEIDGEEKVLGKVDEPKKTKMSVSQYDQKEIVKKVQNSVLALCITSGIHYKWGNAMPLALQSIMIPMNLMDEPLFRIHILGQDAVGKLQRPFKAPDSPFAA